MTYTPLAFAMFRKDSKIIKEILVAAEENSILKDILDATTTIKYLDGQEEIYTPLTYAISCKNSKTIEEILKVSKNLS
ncbi:WD_0033/WD_0034 family tandem repeat-containing protein [Wolbachia endosymbiont (group A) of Lasioglossum malachurum]|uniref:WD_0033/WD_0034 family tandem repeat-containing protein n=1 Tax=Wolbachia endosymbiont (group A) of Lasioglossum malachurum TaxID=2954024 RepID=UPI002220D03C|nr:hypothetical protein [Wolbachia endosymbiont (group A) of Lasioglossum malachurum]